MFTFLNDFILRTTGFVKKPNNIWTLYSPEVWSPAAKMVAPRREALDKTTKINTLIQMEFRRNFYGDVSWIKRNWNTLSINILRNGLHSIKKSIGSTNKTSQYDQDVYLQKFFYFIEMFNFFKISIDRLGITVEWINLEINRVIVGIRRWKKYWKSLLTAQYLQWHKRFCESRKNFNLFNSVLHKKL